MSVPEMRVQDTSRALAGLPVGFRPTLRADTPDPNGYTSVRQANVYMEGASVAGRPLHTLIPQGRGTIIARATRDGASRGVDHSAPQIINVDPHIGGGVIVDLARTDNQALVEAVDQANYDNSDPGEAAFAAYARVADPQAQPHPENWRVLMSPGELQPRQQGFFPQVQHGHHSAQGTVYSQNAYQGQYAQQEERQAPLQMPGAYVVPRATAGGGQAPPPMQVHQPQYQQMAPPPPPPPPQPQQLRGRTPPRGRQEEMDRRAAYAAQSAPEDYAAYAGQPQQPQQPQQQAQQYTVPASFTDVPPDAPRRIRAPLREAFEQPPVQEEQKPPAMLSRMKQVAFELPQSGQFECMYHEVMVEKTNLVLVLDHRQFLQMRYFPPACDEPVAVLVHGGGRERDRLYLCHTTGIRFQHQHNEYCVLLVEQEKDLNGQPAET